MKMTELSIKDEEYKDIFIQTIVNIAKLEPNDIGIAYIEFDAHKESVGDDFVGCPSLEAEECLSYWSE